MAGRGFVGAVGAGEIVDELGGSGCLFALDDRKGAEELLEDVGKDAGFFEGNAVLGEEYEETAQDALNVVGRLDVGEFVEESGGEVVENGKVGVMSGMAFAKESGGEGDGLAAMASGRGTVEAAREFWSFGGGEVAGGGGCERFS